MKYKEHFLFSVLLSAMLMVERYLVPRWTGIKTYSSITALIGLIILLIALRSRTQRRNVLGLQTVKTKIGKCILYAVFVPVIAFVCVLAVEQVVWKATGHSGFFVVPVRDLFFGDYRTASVSWVGMHGFILWMLIGLAVTLVRSFFLELSFRGLIFYHDVRYRNPMAGNIVQSIVFAVVVGIPPLFGLLLSFLNDEMTPQKEWTYIVAAVTLLLYFFLWGYRNGQLRLFGDSILPCILSSWICDFLTEVTNAGSFWPAHLTPFSSVFRMLALHAVVTLLSIPIILHNKKENYQKMQKPTDDRTVDTEKIAEDILRQGKAMEN